MASVNIGRVTNLRRNNPLSFIDRMGDSESTDSEVERGYGELGIWDDCVPAFLTGQKYSSFLPDSVSARFT
jgi:hypothetical protein